MDAEHGRRRRPAAENEFGGPMITYRDRVTPVELGDRVQMRIWFRKHRGRVVYVPGVSPFNGAMEYNGLRWVGVRLEEGGFASLVVDPDAGYLRNRVTFLGRGKEGAVELRPDEDPHGEERSGGGTRAFLIAALFACAAGARAVDAAEPRPEACRADRGVTEGLPKDIRSRIGKAEEMAPCVVASLPEPVRGALAVVARQRQLSMADPGQPWASSDVVPRGTPRQQLVRAAHSDDVWVVDYHKGGFFSSYVVTVVGVDGENGRLLWTGQCHRGKSGRGKWRCAEAVK